jgi:hypothetical protein
MMVIDFEGKSCACATLATARLAAMAASAQARVKDAPLIILSPTAPPGRFRFRRRVHRACAPARQARRRLPQMAGSAKVSPLMKER